MKAFNEDPESIFYGRINTDNIFISGHSRGGGASLISYLQMQNSISGIIDFEGVDITRYGYGSPDISVPFLGFTASEDTDLDYPYCEPTEGQLKAPYTWVTINGGIHAWTASTLPLRNEDNPSIEQWQQHDIQEFYATAFLLEHSQIPDLGSYNVVSILFDLEGASMITENISEQGVFIRWNSWNTQDIVIDDFNGIYSEEPDTEVNLLGGVNISSDLQRSEEVSSYRPDDDNPISQYLKTISRLLVSEDGKTGVFTMWFSDERDDSSEDEEDDFTEIPVPDGFSFQASVKGMDDQTIPETARVVFHSSLGDISLDIYQFIGPLALENRFQQLVIPSSLLPSNIRGVSIELRGSMFIENPRFTNYYHQEN
ncbi:MAG: hypothetical protein JXR95_16480 [Deltaproteobacteria bacterium]|nr:hypothetical protein [Deltaproteobacteria bacterium]